MILPKGYYAVTNDFENASNEFVFKGVSYEVEKGVNLFPIVKEAIAELSLHIPVQSILPPVTAMCLAKQDSTVAAELLSLFCDTYFFRFSYMPSSRRYICKKNIRKQEWGRFRSILFL